MSSILMLGVSDDIKIVGQLGSFLVKTERAGYKIARGFVVPIGKYIGYGLSNEILREFDKAKYRRIILRASPLTETGHIETIAPVERENLIETIRYIQNNALSRREASAIIIQEYLDGEIYGKIHSHNPYTGAENEILIEAKLWANNSVIDDGEDEPEMILVDKKNGTIILESDEEEFCLESEQIQQLYRAVRKLEEKLATPVSLDWGFVNGVLYILRTRQKI